MFFWSLKGTHCLNIMRYHGVSIENTYYYQTASTVTQFIEIYDHVRVPPISHSILWILA